MELFELVDRMVWSRPGVAKKSRSNRMRTQELARALPSNPTPADVAAWMVALDSQFAPGTVDQHRRSLSAVYRYAADLGVSQGNPAALAPARRHKPDPRPIVNIAQLWPTLLDVCQGAREQAFLGVLRFAGLRRGEALGLTRRDVNTQGATWRLNIVRQRPDPNTFDRTPPKSESGCRELPVRGPLRELLAPLLEAADPEVWTGHGGQVSRVVPFLFPFRESDLTALAERLREVAPLAFPRGHKMWHALRDTLVIEMRAGGKSYSECAEVLGHSSEYVTRTSYGGVYGRAVHEDSLAGLDPPTIGARGMVPHAPKKRTAGALTPAVQGSSKPSSPPVTKEGQRCSVPRSSQFQKPLPGMQVQPVVMKPKRSSSGTASTARTATVQGAARSRATSAPRSRPASSRTAPAPVEWSEVVTF